MYPNAVIFDFDGIICDTEKIHYQAFQEILVPLELGYSWEDYQRTYMGFDDRDAFREAFRSGSKVLTVDQLDTLIRSKAHIFETVVSKGVTAYPGVIDLLEDLRTNDIPVAIASGALKSDILPILDQLNIKDNFTAIITAEDVPQSKPDPASYSLAAKILTQKHQLPCNSIIYAIEDTPAGIQSAKGAGLRVIAVTNSYDDLILKDKADIVVNSLQHIVGGRWL